MVKGLERVSWGQPEVKLLRNALWLPEVIRGQPQGNCLAMVGPSNVANATDTEHYAAAGALALTKAPGLAIDGIF